MRSFAIPDSRLAVDDAFEIRPEEMTVQVDGREVSLSPRELKLLTVLAERSGRVVERHVIYEAVWGGRMPRRDRSVDVLVRRLRTKLEAASPGRQVIHTRYGVGYRLDFEA